MQVNVFRRASEQVCCRNAGGGGGICTHMRGTNAAGKQIDEGGHIREGDMNNYEGRFFTTDFPQNVLLTGSCTVKP